MELMSFDVALDPPFGVGLQWSIRGIDPADEIIVQRAESELGPWLTIATLSGTAVSHRDIGVMGSSMWRQYYWRLLVRQPPSADDVLGCLPRSLGRRVDRISAALIRKHALMLYGRHGRGVGPGHWLACYKTPMASGPCPVCTDAITGEVIVSVCASCRGTRKVETWPEPVIFRARFEGSINVATQQGVLEHDEDRRQLRTSNFPLLEPGDHLAEHGVNLVWRVQSIQLSSPGNVPMSQVAIVTRLPAHDPLAWLTFPDVSGAPGPTLTLE